MKKWAVAGIFLPLCLTLSGCSIFETFEGQQDGKPNASANVYELSSGKAYVWDDPEETDIRNDLGQDRTGEPVFFTCPVGDINFKGDELSDIDQYPRSIWISSEKDEEIPTVTSKNALLYISDTKVPEEIVFERFADYGFTGLAVSLFGAEGLPDTPDRCPLEMKGFKILQNRKRFAQSYGHVACVL